MMLFRRLSIPRKILLGFVPLFLLFITVSVLVQSRLQEDSMVEEAQQAANTYGDIVRESMVSMMLNNLEVDTTFIDRVNHLPEIDTLTIIVNSLRLRQELMTPERIARHRVKYATAGPRDSVERAVFASGKPLYQRRDGHFRAIIPFTATNVCQKCHAVPVGYTLGASDLSISFSRMSRSVQNNWQRSALIFLVFVLFAATVAAIFFARYVGRPVDRLVDAATAIAQGNLAASLHTESDENTRDELEILSRHFDDMRRALKEKIAQLDNANLDLFHRNADIERALQQLRQAQDELVRSERLAATGKMTAQLSHEINNPIHNIHSLLESALRKVDGNPQAHELLSAALEEVTRMAKLTRQLMDVYRGSLVRLEHEQVSISDLLLETVRAHAEAFAQRSIRLDCAVPPDLPPVSGSRDRLKQVVLNLILNARDALPQGGTIQVAGDVAGDSVRITVTDTGTGIAPEHLNRIFDAFFTTKKELSGVGLGLTVSYGIIHQHGGTITVDSSLGKGTTFTITLPLAKDEHA